MATRIAKLIGKAYSTSGEVSLTLSYNGSEVFSGTVPTNEGTADMSLFDWSTTEDLCTWNTDTAITGNIAISISPTNGDVILSDIYMNYSALKDLSNVAIDPSTYFSDPNSNSIDSDGKTNIQLDGVAIVQNRSEELSGEWALMIPSGSTMTFDFFVDPEKVLGVA